MKNWIKILLVILCVCAFGDSGTKFKGLVDTGISIKYSGFGSGGAGYTKSNSETICGFGEGGTKAITRLL